MSRLRLVLIKLHVGFQFGRKARESIIHELTRFDHVEGKVFFVEESYWKMHKIVDAKLEKLEIALDVNDNDKNEFSSVVIYFKNFNTKYILTQSHSAPVQENFTTAFFY